MRGGRGVHGGVRLRDTCVARSAVSDPYLDTGLKQLNYLDTKAFLDSSRRALQHIKSCFFFFAQNFFDRGSAGTTEELGGLRGREIKGRGAPRRGDAGKMR